MDYQEGLRQYFTTANHLNDLLPILQCLPLNKTKAFIEKQIDELDDATSKSIYFNSFSMDHIFSADILQYILSFGGLYHTKAVNKQWKVLSANNQRIDLNNKYASVIQNNSPLHYSPNHNSTWIIHPKRKTLHPMESASGFKGPMQDIAKTIAQCTSGDRLLIHDGIYYVPQGLSIDQHIQLIGVGHEVIIGDVDLDDCGHIFCGIGWNKTAADPKISYNVYFENITFDCALSDCTEEAFHLSSFCKLWIKDCNFIFCSKGIVVRNNAYLDVQSCVFLNATSAIEISPIAAEVNIMLSLFKKCGVEWEDSYIGERACISVHNSYLDDRNENGLVVKLKCIGNVFQNNFGFPIAERHLDSDLDPDVFIMNKDRYELRNNILMGYNGTKIFSNVAVDDANKIYYNDQPDKFHY